MFRALQISPLDNIATAMCDIPANMPFDVIRSGCESGDMITARAFIPFAYKVAVRPIDPGENVLKYGEVIGRATTRIEAGELVHVQNLKVVESPHESSLEMSFPIKIP